MIKIEQVGIWREKRERERERKKCYAEEVNDMKRKKDC